MKVIITYRKGGIKLIRKARNTLTFIFIILVFLYLSGMFILRGERIQPNTYINDIDVSSLTREEALTKLREIADSSINDIYMTLKANDKSWKLKYSDLKFRYDFENAVEKAYRIGRGPNFIINVFDALNARLYGTRIKMSYSYEANYIETVLSMIAKEVNQEACDATIKLIGNKFVITDEKKGEELDQKKAYDMIVKSIDNEEISLIKLPMIITEPEIKRKDLEIIKDKLGEYSTNFNTSDTDRSYNIMLATKSVTNVLVKPGNIFSLNKTIGPRLEKFGFKIAKVIVNNELVLGIGGGVCQVSSTLYNAALLSNLKIIERRNHSLPSTYIGLGRDATISGDVIDLKFQNNTKYPIYIYGELKGGKVTFSIYGKNDNPERKVKISTEVISKIQPQMKIIEDPNLPQGNEVIEKKAQMGYVVKSYRIIYENGKEIKREALYTDTYRVSNGVKRVGIMEPVTVKDQLTE